LSGPGGGLGACEKFIVKLAAPDLP
jgi:hypothetical protein